MISLITEITDTKGNRAPRGWICFDRDCAVCSMLAQRFRRVFEKRGYGLAALQDPRVACLLGLAPEDLMREMRVVTEGGVYGGADAAVYLAKQVWWAWPIYATSKLPGLGYVFRRGYRWLADHRSCTSGTMETQESHDAQR
jgi:predicted DCC family thiol-disulfide oxidoreductase YuxK